ncbi:MAG: ribonuclease R [Thermoanaerobaculia bacterium]
MNQIALSQAVRDALRPRGSRTLSFQDVAKAVLGPSATEEQKDGLRVAVAVLERAGEVVRIKGEKLSLIEFTDYQAGVLAIRGEGRAWLLSGQRGVPDIPIAAGKLATALDGDIVLVRIEKQQKPDPPKGRARPDRSPRATSKQQGTIMKVLVRRRENVVGKLVRGPEGTFIDPFDKKIDARLRVPDGKDLGAPTGIFVEARIMAFPDEQRLAIAEVMEIIGFEGDAGVDVEVVARKWGIPRVYPQAVLDEAEAADGVVGADERKKRTDFTNRVIVTIDGETARDFDDAIEAEEIPGGGFRIGIHIADVSHYVDIGSALDAEAFERGTSVYFPDRAIAMLPERLSNDLCSLRPDEERRTLSAVLTLNKKGETTKAEFFRSIIRSRRRLTYNLVASYFKGDPPAGLGITPEVGKMLKVAQKAALALRMHRSFRGSLDFDLPDADVLLGETGDVVSIVKAVRNEAHRLIEEFMLAANEAVAKHLQFVPTPAVYRVHDRPDEDRLIDLRSVLEPLGYDIPGTDDEVSPAIFQRILEQAAGQPEERFVSDLVLRAQKKAIYSVECRGHYALAAKYYCHFTSPIRRYPDLLVHRALVEWIGSKRPPTADEAEGRTLWLEQAATHSSSRERRAESAEREAVTWKKFVFLSKRVGEEFDAIVSAVVPFGMFVTLDQIFVDGLIPMDALGDDFYRYEEVEHRLVGTSTGRIFRLGDPLRVKLMRADFDRRMLDFKPVNQPLVPRRSNRAEPPSRRPSTRRGPAPKRGGGRKR